jgi:prevent-host-death family protein
MSTEEKEVTATAFRLRVGDALLSAHGGARVVISRHGSPIAALVSVAELDKLRALDRKGGK